MNVTVRLRNSGCNGKGWRSGDGDSSGYHCQSDLEREREREREREIERSGGAVSTQNIDRQTEFLTNKTALLTRYKT